MKKKIDVTKGYIGAGANPKPHESDLFSYAIEVRDGLYHLVKYRLNRESRRWLVIHEGEGRDKVSAISELYRAVV